MALFSRATGETVEAVVRAVARESKRAARNRVTAQDKFLPDPANRRGLHPLKALLAERMHDTLRRHTRANIGGATLDNREARELATFDAHGVLALPMDRDMVGGDLNASLAGLLQADDGRVARLLKRVSGYSELCAHHFTSMNSIRHVRGDPQYYAHVDTFHPTVRVWLFPPQTTVSRGPFFYVAGTHRNTQAKLAWLFNRTRTLTTQAARPARKGARQPTSQPRAGGGPFADAVHGFDGSLRVVGFDPRDTGASVAALGTFGFPRPRPLTTGDEYTLVIADTSGVHFRGWAAPGTERWDATLDIGNIIPRKSTYFCADAPNLC